MTGTPDQQGAMAVCDPRQIEPSPKWRAVKRGAGALDGDARYWFYSLLVYYSTALTMSSTTFLASPNTIMVLSM